MCRRFFEVIRAAKRWEAVVKRHFDFLTGYGFRFDHVEDKWWATTAVYLSAALGVEVTRSVEFDRVEITLLRLVEGQAPGPEVWVTDRPSIESFLTTFSKREAPTSSGRSRPAFRGAWSKSSFTCTRSFFVRLCPTSSRGATLLCLRESE